MLIHSNKGNYEKCSIAVTHFCDKSPGYLPFPFSFCAYQAKRLKISMLFGSHIGFMSDFHSIVFLDSQNLGIDTKIGFLSGTVSKLLDI